MKITENEAKELLDMKIKYLLAVSFLFALIFLSGCASAPLTYEVKQSELSDFTVWNGIASVACRITVTNKSDSPVSFRMKGDFAEDQMVGLFKDRYVYAFLRYGESSAAGDIFQIEAKSSQEYDVFFIGQPGGKEEKYDRNPPNSIVFEIQNEE